MNKKPVRMEERIRRAVKYGQIFPKSICACGHSGDGLNSRHGGALGHGSCQKEDCGCQKFTWYAWTPDYEKYQKVAR